MTEAQAQNAITLTLAEYERLLAAAEGDDMLLWCEKCGAWMDRNDPAAAAVQDYEGCWFSATCREKDAHLCYKGTRPGHAEVAARLSALAEHDAAILRDDKARGK